MSEYNLPSSLLLFIYADPFTKDDSLSEAIIDVASRHSKKDHRVTAHKDLPHLVIQGRLQIYTNCANPNKPPTKAVDRRLVLTVLCKRCRGVSTLVSRPAGQCCICLYHVIGGDGQISQLTRFGAVNFQSLTTHVSGTDSHTRKKRVCCDTDTMGHSSQVVWVFRLYKIISTCHEKTVRSTMEGNQTQFSRPAGSKSRKKWETEEKFLLLQLREQNSRVSWAQMQAIFNNNVHPSRHRTTDALACKYKKLISRLAVQPSGSTSSQQDVSPQLLSHDCCLTVISYHLPMMVRS